MSWTQTCTGSCLCGAVAFEIDPGKVQLMNNCHCVNCRKVTGAAYVTMLQVAGDGDGFRWRKGSDHVQTYESSPGVHRPFCKTCGSRVPQSPDFDINVAVPAGLLNDAIARQPDVDMWVDQKTSWYTIASDIPQCEGRGTPEFWSGVLGESPEHWRRIQEQRDNQ